jgi:hypothetical protein
MAADIEFNVRNGMTVGSSKHLVLDVNGALSGSDITCTTGQILSGGSDLFTVLDNLGYLTTADSTNWDSVYTSVSNTSSQWNTAYTWGDHSQQNYLTDYTVTVHDVTGHEGSIEISESQITDLQNYATQAYVTNAISDVISGAPEALNTLNELASALNDDADFAGTITSSIATKWTQDDDKIANWDNTYTSVSTTSSQWNSAYNWGDHSQQNYLTDYTVTVHDVTGHEGSIEITESQITDLQSYLLASDIVSADNWSLAYTTVTANSASWDHSSAGYLTSYTETDPVFTSHAANNITTQKITNWDNTYTDVSTNSASWDHSSAGYLTSETTTTLSLSSESDTLIYTDEDGSETQISLAAYTGEGVSAIADATDTTFTSLSGGDVLVYVNGGTQKWQNKKDRASLEDMYNYANANFYSEMTYSITDQLTGVYVWVTSNKTTALFERDLTYNASGQLTSVVTRDVQGTGGSTRATLTKNLAYTATGALSSTTRSYS